MFSGKSVILCGFIAVASTVEATTATQPVSEESIAVSAVAALQICQERNPERGLTLERLVSDTTFSEERRSVFRKVYADPAYKKEISTMKAFLLEPPLTHVLRDICENLRKTSPDGYR
ncbi:hypothetical protein AQS70_02270 [Pseudomonas endophytica]|uniref:Uncharacterized protein n=1 Tax=Pseudomonas endophytica TaxID=1563157 RepID=A0A0Q0XTG3_9PSED|nr:hypothetical protein [Pseudomonas endophytica]KQB53598.1 hypothetical protein AQS70_02270 [Pseudomonas endophytica]